MPNYKMALRAERYEIPVEKLHGGIFMKRRYVMDLQGFPGLTPLAKRLLDNMPVPDFVPLRAPKRLRSTLAHIGNFLEIAVHVISTLLKLNRRLSQAQEQALSS